MELDHLHTFFVVAKELGFSKAAKRLRVQQPTVSKSVQNLEATLGVKLFERTKRSVRLTSDGNEIFKICQDKRVPCAPIYNIAEVMNHDQLKAMDFFVELDHQKAGTLKYAKGPCTFEKTNWEWQTAAPLLGQDNEKVYGGLLGFSQTEIAGMKKSGVI